MNLKEKYRSLCEKRGLELQQAAAQMAYTPEHIHRVLTGRSRPNVRLARILYQWSDGEIDVGVEREDEAA